MLKSLGCCTAKTLKDDHGWTVLMWAALAGNVDICDMLVKSYDAAADYVTERGESALMKAAANGHWEAKLLLVLFSSAGPREVCDFLLEEGAKVNQLDSEHQTALMWAAAMGHTAVVRGLISRDAKVDLPSKGGKTALLLACAVGRDSVVAEPWPDNDLLAARAKIEHQDADGQNGLFGAVQCGNKDLVSLLIQHKCPLEAHTQRGETPLMFAAMNQQIDCVKVLCAASADVNAVDENGQRAIDHAEGTLNSKVVEVLQIVGVERRLRLLTTLVAVRGGALPRRAFGTVRVEWDQDVGDCGRVAAQPAFNAKCMSSETDLKPFEAYGRGALRPRSRRWSCPIQLLVHRGSTAGPRLCFEQCYRSFQFLPNRMRTQSFGLGQDFFSEDEEEEDDEVIDVQPFVRPRRGGVCAEPWTKGYYKDFSEKLWTKHSAWERILFDTMRGATVFKQFGDRDMERFIRPMVLEMHKCGYGSEDQGEESQHGRPKQHPEDPWNRAPSEYFEYQRNDDRDLPPHYQDHLHDNQANPHSYRYTLKRTSEAEAKE
eukprot:s3714_g3.t1